MQNMQAFARFSHHLRMKASTSKPEPLSSRLRRKQDMLKLPHQQANAARNQPSML